MSTCFFREAIRCPSPPPESPVQKQSRKVKQKIRWVWILSSAGVHTRTQLTSLQRGWKNSTCLKTLMLCLLCVCLSEIDRKLQAVNSLLSPESKDTRTRHYQRPASPDDDVIILIPNSGSQDSLYGSSDREIPLKIRCRTDIHKIPVLSVRHSEKKKTFRKLLQWWRECSQPLMQ